MLSEMPIFNYSITIGRNFARALFCFTDLSGDKLHGDVGAFFHPQHFKFLWGTVRPWFNIRVKVEVGVKSRLHTFKVLS